MKVLIYLLAILLLNCANAGNSVLEENIQLAAQTQNSKKPSTPSWLKNLNGFIVWSSNRAGNHDIWQMNLPDLEINQLTNHPNTENFARISPDGTKMAFSRSHRPHQGMRDKRPWDVWLLDLKTGEEEKVASFGLAPSWAADGNSIIFQRSPDKIISYDLQTRKESIYYQSGQDEVVKQAVDLNTPSIGHSGQLAFTYRNHGQPTNIIRDQNGVFNVVHRDSCQVMWSPSGDFITYVQKGGKQINQIMHYDPITGQKTTLIDLPGEFSHEYFPRLTQNEKYLIFAASNGGHAHDLADYELFLWPVGESQDSAFRLTHHLGNDSWPDIRLPHQ